MAKLLFFAHFSGEGIISGADKVLLNIAQHRQSVGDQVLVVFPTACYATHYFQKCGIRIAILPYPFFYEAINPSSDAAVRFENWYNEHRCCLLSLQELLREEQAELIHVNTIINPWSAIAAQQLGIPVLWHIHELFQGGSTAGQLTIRKILAAYADRIICASEAVRKDFLLDNSPEKYQVVHNGIKSLDWGVRAQPRLRTCWRKKMQIADKVPVAAFLGSILHHKGVFEFVQMAGVVKQSYPEVVFVLGGNERLDVEYTQFIRDQVCNLGLQQNVIFAGYYEDVSEFLLGIDILVVSTIIRETFGMVIIEAMAHQKPVVAFKSGGISEIIIQGETGFMVPRGDIIALAARVKQLLANRKQAELMGQAGAQRVKAQFGLTRQMQGIDSIYRQILG